MIRMQWLVALCLAVSASANYQVECWGSGTAAQLAPPPHIQSQRVGFLAMGTDFSCARPYSRTSQSRVDLECWGDNSSGQLNPPSIKDGQFDVKNELIALGDGFGCMLTTQPSKDILCWGSSEKLAKLLPTNIVYSDWSFFNDLTCGTSHCCIEGSHLTPIYCWGDTAFQQTTVYPPDVVVDVKCVGNLCCLYGENGVDCWGQNSGTMNTNAPTMSELFQGSYHWNFDYFLGLGTNYACVLDKSYAAHSFCWGVGGTGLPRGDLRELEFSARSFHAGSNFDCFHANDPVHSLVCLGNGSVVQDLPSYYRQPRNYSEHQDNVVVEAIAANAASSFICVAGHGYPTTTMTMTETMTSVTSTVSSSTSSSSTASASSSTSISSSSSSTLSSSSTTSMSSSSSTSGTGSSSSTSTSSTSSSSKTFSTSSSSTVTWSSSTGTTTASSTGLTSSASANANQPSTAPVAPQQHQALGSSTTLSEGVQALGSSTTLSEGVQTTGATTVAQEISAAGSVPVSTSPSPGFEEASSATFQREKAVDTTTMVPSATSYSSEAASSASSATFQREKAVDTTTMVLSATSYSSEAASSVMPLVLSATSDSSEEALPLTPSVPSATSDSSDVALFVVPAVSSTSSHKVDQVGTSKPVVSSTTSQSAETVETPKPAVPTGVAELLSSVALAKSSLLQAIESKDADNVTIDVAGEGTLFATKLSAVKANGGIQSSDGKVEFWVNSTDIEVKLPASVISKYSDLVLTPKQPGDEVMVSTVVVEPQRSIMLGALGATVLEFHWLRSGEKLPVEGLQEPILFSLNVSYTGKDMQCAYWDEIGGRWSTRGVAVSQKSVLGGDLWCETTHLSLFGAIIKGIIDNVLCTNLELFTLAALRQIFMGLWYTAWGSIVCWFVIAASAVSFLAAAIVDFRRNRQFPVSNELFLVTREECPDARQNSSSFKKAKGCTSCTCPTTMLGRLVWYLLGSSAFKEAVDDIMSRWFEHFADVRSICESFCSGLELDTAGLRSQSSFSRVSHRFMIHMMMLASRRATAASLGMSSDLVSLVLDSEEMARYITVHKEREADEVEDGKALDHQAAPVSDWRLSTTQGAMWDALRKKVAEALLKHVTAHSKPWSVVGIAKIFLHQNPLGELFVVDLVQSCKQKVAVLIAELWGSFALSGLFFQASGMVRGKSLGGAEEACGDGANESFGHNIGRFIVIGLGSLLVAGVPVILLESLQTKSFKRMQCSRGSEAWQRQLRAWRLQDQLFWITAVLYIAACMTFVLAFLANVGSEDHREWSLVGMLTLLQDFLLLPLALAATLSLGAKVLLRVHSQVHQIQEQQIVRKVRELLHKETNIMLPIEHI